MRNPVGLAFVAAQGVAFLALAFVPGHAFEVVSAGSAFVLAGIVLAIAASATLGRSLTPFPEPAADATLVLRGPYRFVRHPIYAALLLIAFGFALATASWPRCVVAIVLAVVLDRKAAYEERWLRERYPDYAAYAARVRRLIPFVY